MSEEFKQMLIKAREKYIEPQIEEFKEEEKCERMGGDFPAQLNDE